MADAARLDRLGAALFVAATLGLLAAWPGWRLSDAAPADAYAQQPDDFLRQAEAFVDTYQVGERDGLPLVHPPPGAAIPVVARRFQFWPALDLEAGRTYTLHIASVDTVHSVVVQGHELALLPGQVRVIEIHSGLELVLQCGEYCGLGHTRMRAVGRSIR
jgi:cytochrome c oxidase subunit 2